jgi:hypothetical protein
MNLREIWGQMRGLLKDCQGFFIPSLFQERLPPRREFRHTIIHCFAFLSLISLMSHSNMRASGRSQVGAIPLSPHHPES